MDQVPSLWFNSQGGSGVSTCRQSAFGRGRWGSPRGLGCSGVPSSSVHMYSEARVASATECVTSVLSPRRELSVMPAVHVLSLRGPCGGLASSTSSCRSPALAGLLGLDIKAAREVGGHRMAPISTESGVWVRQPEGDLLLGPLQKNQLGRSLLCRGRQTTQASGLRAACSASSETPTPAAQGLDAALVMQACLLWCPQTASSAF